MNELEEIKKRLLAAEIQVELLQDQLWSHQQMLVTLLRLLHEKELLALPDVIAALQSRAAFGQAAFGMKPPQMLQPMIEMLQTIADAYQARGRPQ